MHQKRIVYRDYQARNVMLGAGNKVKLGDFGLARRMVAGQDYWKIDKAGRLPARYMAVESFATKTFSEKTDVWAFGVFAWEVMT